MRQCTPVARLLIAIALVLATLGGAAAPAAAKAGSVNGRLGGSQASFESRFGKAVGGAQSSVLSFTANGYGPVTVVFDAKGAVSVAVAADRVDWTPARSIAVAKKFLPTDAAIDGPALDTGDGRFEVACHSARLAQAFDAAAWKRLKAGGRPGDCHVLLSPDAAGDVSAMEIGIGRSGALDRPTPTAVPPTPEPTYAPDPTQAPGGISFQDPTPADPEPAVDATNGATALCVDGTLSYAAHHQGACSHHGGVAEFYK